MIRFGLISLLFLSLTTIAACSPDNPYNPEEPEQLSGDSKTLVAYFSATGTTQRVSERIVDITGADVYRIEAADPYADNPYDDSDRIQHEAYNDLRPYSA